jgi:hypothetical protein
LPKVTAQQAQFNVFIIGKHAEDSHAGFKPQLHDILEQTDDIGKGLVLPCYPKPDRHWKKPE